MLNVLVANKHTEESLTICNALSQNYEIKPSISHTGIETIEMYNKLSPQLLVLDSGFNDISFYEIMNRLSSMIFESRNCNTILTLENKEDLSLLSNLGKVWKSFVKPLDYTEIVNSINEVKPFYEIPTLYEYEIDSVLISLSLHMGAPGTQYLKRAILECYYDKYMFRSLDNIYALIATETNKPIKEIRDAMRNALAPLRKYSGYNDISKFLLQFFGEQKNVGTKLFLEVVVTYFHRIKNKNKT